MILTDFAFVKYAIEIGSIASAFETKQSSLESETVLIVTLPFLNPKQD